MEDIFKNFAPKSVVYTPRSDAGEVSILGSVQMSKGDVMFKNMHIMYVSSEDGTRDSYYILQCSGELPRESLWRQRSRSRSGDFMCEEITLDLAQVFESAICRYKKEEFKEGLNPYSYIYGFVVSRYGISLHDMWSFSVEQFSEGRKGWNGKEMIVRCLETPPFIIIVLQCCFESFNHISKSFAFVQRHLKFFKCVHI